MAKLFFDKLKSPPKGRLSSVDPAGVAPAFPLVKGGVLLHKLWARIHTLKIKQKKPSYKDIFCWQVGARNLWVPPRESMMLNVNTVKYRLWITYYALNEVNKTAHQVGQKHRPKI